MSLADKVLAVNNDLPIRTERPVHSGKVRSVYWLTAQDSARLIAEHGYPVAADAQLAVMVISDRISAYECLWRGEGNLHGIPGKGAALNAISNHWFNRFKERGLARSHIVDTPHPLVWIVQQARPVMIEAICRQYITGSMWRAYAAGERDFCGIQLTDGLRRDQRLDQLLITPSTKGVISGIDGIPEVDDVNVSRAQIADHYRAFNFNCAADIARYEQLLSEGFELISAEMADHDQLFVDTKFEFGYARNAQGDDELIYMDEVGTPDSSRIWDGASYRDGVVLERSKEQFRQFLLNHFADADILTNKDRMAERYALARDNELPAQIMHDVAATYRQTAEQITGQPLQIADDPRAEIVELLANRYQLID